MKHYIKLLLFFLIFSFIASAGLAQFIYFPYYGKNKVLYEKFDWNHYQTEHFDIYYYADDPNVLKNVAELAESAYARISDDLKYQLSKPVPIIFYTTHTDFEQTNLFPGQVPESVMAFAESVLHRIVLQGDMSLDALQDLTEHELTHIFQYSMLYGSQAGPIYDVRQPPLWVIEGQAEYNTEFWSPISLMVVRDAVLNDRIPELSKAGNLFSRYPTPRDPNYEFGHAIYDFLEYKFGKSGIRQLWNSLKHTALVGKKDPVNKVFKYKPEDFNFEFKKYLRNRFNDFLMRDNPENYSVPLGPHFPLNPYYFAFSHVLSPSGDILAVLTLNSRDYDFDILLISTKDGSVIKNITKGYTLKYEYIKYNAYLDPTYGRDIAWSSDGDQITFFARTGQKHSLFVIDALSGKTIKKINISVDQPASPCFLPSGEELLFSGFHKGTHDIFKVNLSNGKILNLTEDELYEKAPTISPDGRTVAYTIRIDTYDKLVISPINNLRKKTQLTFGRGNTVAPQFSHDSKEIYFSGDMRDAYNIYSIDLESGELRRYTDVRTGNLFPSPMPNESKKIIFSSFHKGAFQIFKSELEGEAEKTIAFKEIQEPKSVKIFEPIVSLEINEEKIKPHKGVGKLYLTSRPPIDAIVSSDGSLYGGSAISFADLLGDHTFYLMAYQVRSFRSYYFAYLNQKRRFQYMASAFQYTLFYYPPYAYYDPTLYNYMSYRDAIATRKITGINLSTYYPFNKYYRGQASLGFYRYEEDFLDPFIKESLFLSGGSYTGFWNGNWLSASFSLVGETTRFKYYGPAAGNTFMLSLAQAIPVSDSFLQNTNIQVDLRKYTNLGADIIFAVRFEGFASRGRDPFVYYFGGNNQVRSAHYANIIAHEGWFVNAELRFPIINAASTIIGQIGPIRGTLFVDVARAKLKGYPAKFYSYVGFDEFGYSILREVDSIGSFGYGFEFFFLGIPIHLEFVKRLEFPDISKPFDYDVIGDFETKFWIGFDF
ncbi:MAG: hypothetical protein ACETWK_12320 [Candidatus Aminicenantaceae bacterium]